MSRNTGTFNFAANFEGLLKAPIDAKQLVGTYADLTLPATWCGSGSVWLYNGAIVSVGSDTTPANNGIYYLCDSVHYTNTCSWIKVGSGSVTGATNGLSVSGASIILGGSLNQNTTINGECNYSLNSTNLCGFSFNSFNNTMQICGSETINGTSIKLSSGTMSLVMDHETPSTGITITGGIGFRGAEYGSNYSLNFTNRSLIDKEYADSIVSGLRPKAEVRVATTGNTILSGLTIIDNITLLNGDRVLVKNQISGETNGVYIASASTWTRALDFDGMPSGEVVAGTYMWVLSGHTNGNTAWVLTTPDPITIGVTPLTFVLFNHVSDVIGGTGITVGMLNGTHIISVDGNSLVGNSIMWSGDTFNVDTNSGTLNSVLNNKLNVSTFNTYTGITNPILTSALTGATNGLNINERVVKLGGTLTGNTRIDLASYNLNLANGKIVSSGNTGQGFDSYSNYKLSGSTFISTASKRFGCGNTAIGYQAISGNSGLYNTAIGFKSNGDNTNGCYNVSLGYNSLTLNNSGDSNVAIGAYSLYYNIVGVRNTAVGFNALLNNVNNYNTAVGFQSLTNNNTGSYNTGVGYNAGGNNSTGSSNVFIGHCAGYNETGSNNLYIANSETSNPLIKGNFTASAITLNGTLAIANVYSGATTDGILVWNSLDKKVKTIGDSILIGNAITGATNGLTKTNKLVKLGGTLTGNTTFDGSVSNYHLKYNADYSSTFNARSIPDVGYVTGYTALKSNVVNICNINTTYTATTASDFIGVSGTSNIYLPSSPKLGQRISIADICGNALNSNIIINGNGRCINDASCSIINTDYGSVTLINNGKFWSGIAFIN